MRFLVVISLVVGLLAYGEENFRVEELSLAEVTALQVASNKVDEAAKAFQAAAKKLEEAKQSKKEVVRETLKKHNLYERDACAYSQLGSAAGESPFLEAEIRGRYILVTEGTKQCDNLVYLTTDTADTLWVR